MPKEHVGGNTNLYIGTSGYSYKEWKGTFYSVELPAKEMLHYYGEQMGPENRYPIICRECGTKIQGIVAGGTYIQRHEIGSGDSARLPPPDETIRGHVFCNYHPAGNPGGGADDPTGPCLAAALGRAFERSIKRLAVSEGEGGNGHVLTLNIRKFLDIYTGVAGSRHFSFLNGNCFATKPSMP